MTSWGWISLGIAGIALAGLLAGRLWVDRQRGSVNAVPLLEGLVGGIIGTMLFVAQVSRDQLPLVVAIALIAMGVGFVVIIRQHRINALLGWSIAAVVSTACAVVVLGQLAGGIPVTK